MKCFSYQLTILFLLFTFAQCGPSPTQPPLKDWQAVFLTNGQIYYGKLELTNGPFYRLSNVYYLRQTPPTDSKAQDNAQPKFRLIKFGGEIQGPEDSILLNRDHILYFENLRSNSPLVKKIQDSQKQQEKTADPSPLSADQLSPQELEQFRKFQRFQQSQQKN